MRALRTTRYTSGEPHVVSALWQYGVAYNFEWSWAKVTTLNRIKNFLAEYLSIQQPTKRLVLWILEYTNSGTYLWEWVDLTGNICNFFLVHVEKFTQSVKDLLDQWILIQKKKCIDGEQ